ncbi:MAG: hypothetical protein H7240_08235 [Glaciimonas sp.]|nr:hypothetical protein [Glaciimonas sp.]
MAQTNHAAQAALKQSLVGTKLDTEIRHLAARTLNLNSFHGMLVNLANRIRARTEKRDALGIPQSEITYEIDNYVKKVPL